MFTPLEPIDIDGFFIRGYGLPSELEEEDYITMLRIQKRIQRIMEDAEAEAFTMRKSRELRSA